MNLDKDKVLKQIQDWVTSGVVSREEVIFSINNEYDNTVVEKRQETTVVDSYNYVEDGVREQSSQSNKADSWTSLMSIKKILYVLGGLVLMIGIVFYIAEIWMYLGSFGQIMVTFGVGIFLLFLGYIYNNYGAHILSNVFNILGSMLFLFGGLVVLTIIDSETSINVTETWLFISLLLSAVFFTVLAFVQKSLPLVFFAISCAVASVYVFLLVIYVNFIISRLVQTELVQWTNIILGMLLLYFMAPLKRTFAGKISPLLGFAGLNLVLLTVWWRMFDSGLWELVFLFACVGVIALNVFMRNTILMFIGVIYLFAYIVYITNKYFAYSIGWPIAMMFLGVVLLSLGYVTFKVYDSYLKQT